MKTLQSIACVALLFFTTILSAQEVYTVDGKEYTLNTEIEGPLSLLWTTVDGEYRYFLKKGNKVTELLNTKSDSGYKMEYKEVLRDQAEDPESSLKKLKFTLPSLREYVGKYNSAKDPNYTYDSKKVNINMRLGVFGGITNTAYYINPQNTYLPVLGVEFELFDDQRLRRHAAVFRFKQIIGNSKYDFNSSQISFNYRLKFIASQKVDVYANAKFVSLNINSRDITYLSNSNEPVRSKGSQTELRAPVAFGLGADFAIWDGHLMLTINDIVSISDSYANKGDFPVDVTLGYKINL